MTQPKVQTDQSMSEPSPWLDIADELEKIAEDLRALAGEPGPAQFAIHIQPKSYNKPETPAAVDAITEALLARPGETTLLPGGIYHHRADGERGPVSLKVYGRVPQPEIAGAAEELAQLRAENERLRAEVATERFGQKQVQPGRYDGRGAPFDEPHPSWPNESELKPCRSAGPDRAPPRTVRATPTSGPFVVLDRRGARGEGSAGPRAHPPSAEPSERT